MKKRLKSLLVFCIVMPKFLKNKGVSTPVALALVLIFGLILVGGAIYWQYYNIEREQTEGPSIKSIIEISDFKECVIKGYSILESYPRQCRTSDGRIFTEDIGNELDKTDLIIVSSPRPNDFIQSPLTVTGEARGNWFFEASFPVKLVDESGNELAVGIAQALSDWMTEEFVPFRVEIEFPAIDSQKLILVLEKDNPSGLPENADKLIIPLYFEKRIVEGEQEQACLNSGGKIKTSSCCGSIGDFPNLCLVGACGCSPMYSHEIKICACEEGKCFDGKSCVERGR